MSDRVRPSSGPWTPYTFGFGQWSLLNLATWIQTYDPDFYAKYGGNNSLYADTGQVTGPEEIIQRQDALRVSQNMSKDFPSVEAEVKKLGLGYVSQSDPNYFVPYWSRFNDVEVVQSGLASGAGLEDCRTSLLNVGYDDSVIPDMLLEAACVGAGHHVASYWPGIGGMTSYASLARVLRAWWAFYFTDPVMFVDQTTGELSPELTYWAYHIGGERCNVSIRKPTKMGGALSYILTSIQCFFDMQSAAILYALTPKFLDKFNDVLAVGKTVGPNDIGPVPVSPEMLTYLASSSKFNKYKVTPPTYGDSWLYLMFSGVNPLVLTGTPNSTPITFEGKTSALARNDVFLTQVSGILASRMQQWLDADAGRLFPPPTDRTLRLIAMPK